MRTIVAIGLVVTLMGAPIQARAENGQVAAGILGGLAAGALIGSAVRPPPPPPAYYYPAPPTRLHHPPTWRRRRAITRPASPCGTASEACGCAPPSRYATKQRFPGCPTDRGSGS